MIPCFSVIYNKNRAFATDDLGNIKAFDNISVLPESGVSLFYVPFPLIIKIKFAVRSKNGKTVYIGRGGDNDIVSSDLFLKKRLGALLRFAETFSAEAICLNRKNADNKNRGDNVRRFFHLRNGAGKSKKQKSVKHDRSLRDAQMK